LEPVATFFFGVLVEAAAFVEGLSWNSGSSILTSWSSSSRGLFREDSVAAAAAVAVAAAAAAVYCRSKSSLACESAVTWCYRILLVLVCVCCLLFVVFLEAEGKPGDGLSSNKKGSGQKRSGKANLELELVGFKLLVLGAEQLPLPFRPCRHLRHLLFVVPAGLPHLILK